MVIDELSQCTEMKEQRINELEHSVTKLADKVVSANKAYQKERRKKKSEALAEYTGDVQRLQIKRSNLKVSVDNLQISWNKKKKVVKTLVYINSNC